jgi:hypothetical protein
MDDDEFTGFVYLVSGRARLGPVRAHALHEIIDAYGVSGQVKRGRAGYTLHLYGRRELIAHLRATLNDTAASLDRAALQATRRYGTWLRHQSEPDHVVADRVGLRRAWRRQYLVGWALAYSLRLLCTATEQMYCPQVANPVIGHTTAHQVAAWDVALLDATSFLVSAKLIRNSRSPR